MIFEVGDGLVGDGFLGSCAIVEEDPQGGVPVSKSSVGY